MKVAILAGGFGSRLAEETEVRPKPMVEIGGQPILWHIMSHYARYGHTDFAVALGYKGDYIKRWFADYCSLQGSLSVDLSSGEIRSHTADGRPATRVEGWRVDLVETGAATMTGGRIKRLAPWLGSETFLLTWGDGVADVDLDRLLAFHRSHGRIATVTAVRPAARYGRLELEGDQVVDFTEKPQLGEGWINGAFFVLEPAVFDYIDGDDVMFEQSPMERLARDGQLMAYRHEGFWQCMDTLREKKILEDLWAKGAAPWAPPRDDRR